MSSASFARMCAGSAYAGVSTGESLGLLLSHRASPVHRCAVVGQPIFCSTRAPSRGNAKLRLLHFISVLPKFDMGKTLDKTKKRFLTIDTPR